MLKILAGFMITIGTALLLVNLYGLTQDIQPKQITGRDFRFPVDKTLSYEEVLPLLVKTEEQSTVEFSIHSSETISKALAHIHWNEETDPTIFHQRVPVWENYFLYIMSFITQMPEYEKYHYADYQRSLKRGIGICGDASLVMSQVLDENGINNQMVSFPGHVILEADTGTGAKYTYDPDFGVSIPHSIEAISASPDIVRGYYLSKGYSEREVKVLTSLYSKNFERWDGVTHFMTKKYYFEQFAYIMKWPLPLLLLIMGYQLIRRSPPKA